jgi:hypothetical protein
MQSAAALATAALVVVVPMVQRAALLDIGLAGGADSDLQVLNRAKKVTGKGRNESSIIIVRHRMN